MKIIEMEDLHLRWTFSGFLLLLERATLTLSRLQGELLGRCTFSSSILLFYFFLSTRDRTSLAALSLLFFLSELKINEEEEEEEKVEEKDSGDCSFKVSDRGKGDFGDEAPTAYGELGSIWGIGSSVNGKLSSNFMMLSNCKKRNVEGDMTWV